MKRRIPKRKPNVERFFTYNVSVSFDMQYTFEESEIQPSEEGAEGDYDPSDEAIANLEKELTEYLRQAYSADNMDVFADFDSLLGVVENALPRKKEPETTPRPVTKEG